jgi:hypothetical protein
MGEKRFELRDGILTYAKSQGGAAIASVVRQRAKRAKREKEREKESKERERENEEKPFFALGFLSHFIRFWNPGRKLRRPTAKARSCAFSW